MTMSFNYLQCPVLVAWGEKDPWDPIKLGRAYGNFDAAPQVSPLSNEVTLYSSSYWISVNFAGWEAGNGEPTYWISRCETFKVQYSPCSRHLISVSFTLFVYLYRNISSEPAWIVNMWELSVTKQWLHAYLWWSRDLSKGNKTFRSRLAIKISKPALNIYNPKAGESYPRPNKTKI